MSKPQVLDPVRLSQIKVAIVFLSILIVLRLAYIQIVRHDYFQTLAIDQVRGFEKRQAAAEESRRKLGMRSSAALLEDLKDRLARIESIPISALRCLVDDAARLIEVTIAEREAIELANIQTQAALEKKLGEITVYNSQLADLKSLTDAQRRTVRILLSDVVREESNRSFWKGVIWSFLAGFLTSALVNIFTNLIRGRNEKSKDKGRQDVLPFGGDE